MAFGWWLLLHWASWENIVSLIKKLFMRSSLRCKAEFRAAVHAAVSLLIQLLRDKNADAQRVAASSLGELAKYCGSY
jgi:hypothetical protein